jgi:hypothetical protein
VAREAERRQGAGNDEKHSDRPHPHRIGRGPAALEIPC